MVGEKDGTSIPRSLSYCIKMHWHIAQARSSHDSNTSSWTLAVSEAVSEAVYNVKKRD